MDYNDYRFLPERVRVGFTRYCQCKAGRRRLGRSVPGEQAGVGGGSCGRSVWVAFKKAARLRRCRGEAKRYKLNAIHPCRFTKCTCTMHDARCRPIPPPRRFNTSRVIICSAPRNRPSDLPPSAAAWAPERPPGRPSLGFSRDPLGPLVLTIEIILRTPGPFVPPKR